LQGRADELIDYNFVPPYLIFKGFIVGAVVGSLAGAVYAVSKNYFQGSKKDPKLFQIKV
jgi:hypothetical protein